MKCATVFGAGQVVPWIEHKRRGADAKHFLLGETWWWTTQEAVSIDPSLPDAMGRVSRVSVRNHKTGIELIAPFRKDSDTMTLVHLKVMPFTNGGIRYKARFKTGQALARRSITIEHSNGKQPVHELLLSMGAGDIVVASRTGVLPRDAASELLIACSENRQLSVREIR